jgi:hypothetical protein
MHLKNYVLFDFNKPDGFPEEMKGTFDMVVIDPPFITREVWQKYTEVRGKDLRPGPQSSRTLGPSTRAQACGVDVGHPRGARTAVLDAHSTCTRRKLL